MVVNMQRSGIYADYGTIYAKQGATDNFSSLTNLLSSLSQVLQLLNLKGVKDTKIGDEVFCSEKRFKGILL